MQSKIAENCRVVEAPTGAANIRQYDSMPNQSIEQRVNKLLWHGIYLIL